MVCIVTVRWRYSRIPWYDVIVLMLIELPGDDSSEKISVWVTMCFNHTSVTPVAYVHVLMLNGLRRCETDTASAVIFLFTAQVHRWEN
jgi:hypothetical protein